MAGIGRATASAADQRGDIASKRPTSGPGSMAATNVILTGVADGLRLGRGAIRFDCL